MFQRQINLDRHGPAQNLTFVTFSRLLRSCCSLPLTVSPRLPTADTLLKLTWNLLNTFFEMEALNVNLQILLERRWVGERVLYISFMPHMMQDFNSKYLKEKIIEFFMEYQAFLAILWFGSSPTHSPSPVVKLSLFLCLPVCRRASLHKHVKGIDWPFGGGVESILIRSVFVNWRLGNFFYLILNGLHHKISKKLLYAA